MRFLARLTTAGGSFCVAFSMASRSTTRYGRGLRRDAGHLRQVRADVLRHSAGDGCTLADVPKTVRQIEKILRANDWTLARTVGSHRQYVHPENPNVITVPGAPGKEVATGTLSSIRRASGIKELR